jgi:hypothetical protein
MDFYYKSDRNIAYVTTTKNGSTLMSNLSRADPSLQHLDIDSAIRMIVEKDAKIYAPYRHPYVRFISGLEVNFFNNTDFFDGFVKGPGFPTATDAKQYKNFVRYLDRAMYTPGTSIGSYYYRPYHLFDQHLDHWLIIPFVLVLYNLNVEMIPMHQLSDHLLQLFPKCEEHIRKSERKGSFDQPQEHLMPLWNAYKTIMNNPPTRFKPVMMEFISFEKWLEPEIRVFNLFNTPLKNTNIQYEANKIFEKVAENGDYFYDLWSHRNQQMYKVIRNLHEYVKPLDFFLALEQNISQFVWAMEENQKIYKEQLELINRSVTQNTLPKPRIDVL